VADRPPSVPLLPAPRCRLPVMQVANPLCRPGAALSGTADSVVQTSAPAVHRCIPLTVSFWTMVCAPWNGSFSKVNIEFSLYLHISFHLPTLLSSASRIAPQAVSGLHQRSCSRNQRTVERCPGNWPWLRATRGLCEFGVARSGKGCYSSPCRLQKSCSLESSERLKRQQFRPGRSPHNK